MELFLNTLADLAGYEIEIKEENNGFTDFRDAVGTLRDGMRDMVRRDDSQG